MEWVEVTGKTVEEAKERALDQLGVDADEAEFEILEEPKPGLFGRLRSEARVRARVAPTVPRPKLDRRDRRRPRRSRGSGDSGGRPADTVGSGSGSGGGDGGEGRAAKAARGPREATSDRTRNTGDDDVADDIVAENIGVDDMAGDDGDDGDDGDADEVEVAEEFLAGLLDTFGADYTIERQELEDDLVELSVRGDDLGLLIGGRGQTLSAVQELARTVVQRQSRGRPGRIIVDIAGYRQARRQALERFANQVADEVRESGVARVLEPMPPADRKVVHDAINVLPGVTTSSEGEEPRRRVVISAEPAE